MARILSKSRSLKRQGVTIVLLLLLAGGYYALVVPGKTAYFKDRYFRQLAECNDNLSQTIGTLCSSLVNAATKSYGAKNKSPDQIIKDTLDLSPFFTRVLFSTNAPSNTNEPALRLGVLTNSTSPTLELQFTGTNGLQVTTHSELAKLTKAFVSRSEFHDVLLVGRTGEVLHQLTPGSLRMSCLGFSIRESFTTNLVNLAGGDFRLFAQPVRISGPPGSASNTLDWVLCGLVREEQFRQQTRAMDYTVLAAFCIVALMLVVSWPLLNLWGGGLRGGLGPVEILLLAGSAIFVTALLTLTALDRFAYGGAKAQLDERLQTFAADLVTNLNSELKAVAQQLEVLDQKAKEHRTDGDFPPALFHGAQRPAVPLVSNGFLDQCGRTTNQQMDRQGSEHAADQRSRPGILQHDRRRAGVDERQRLDHQALLH